MLDGVIVALEGGLGNQMFQYAAGRSLALRNRAPLLLDIRAVEADPQRAYALDGFCVASVVATDAQGAVLPRRVHRLLRWLPRRPGEIHPVFERRFSFNPTVLELKAPVYLDGYWQSEKYFVEFADDIRKDFQLREPLCPDRQAIATAIAANVSVSIHVRRGDYVSNAAANAYHGTVGPEWYARAMARMEARVGAPTYFVFSDDPEWARANLPARDHMQFIAPMADGRDFEDLHLMARCQHHIIANSSFSWWGAWLNRRPDRLVIAPSRWFGRARHDTSDLLPRDWVQM